MGDPFDIAATGEIYNESGELRGSQDGVDLIGRDGR